MNETVRLTKDEVKKAINMKYPKRPVKCGTIPCDPILLQNFHSIFGTIYTHNHDWLALAPLPRNVYRYSTLMLDALNGLSTA